MNVYLVTRPAIDAPALNAFIRDNAPDVYEAQLEPLVSDRSAERIVEAAARLCYMSFAKGRRTAREFFANIIRKRHFSVLEHANYGFIITGVSRSLTHELVRHRHLSFSQLSQRFVADQDGLVMPPLISAMNTKGHKDISKEESAHIQAFLDATDAAFTAYNNLADGAKDMLPAKRKKVLEAARSVLPNATETKIFVTGNLRAWREFIEKRDSPYADAEIRQLAQLIETMLEAEAPNLMWDWD